MELYEAAEQPLAFDQKSLLATEAVEVGGVGSCLLVGGLLAPEGAVGGGRN